MDKLLNEGIVVTKAYDHPVRDGGSISRILEIFQALSHSVRLQICQLLITRPYSVGELCSVLGLKQYAVSQQLAVLRKAEIVVTKRSSRQIFYILSSDKVRRVLRVSFANLSAPPENEPTTYLDKKQQAGSFAKLR